MKAMMTTLLTLMLSVCLAVPSIVITAGSIECENEANVIINNGNLTIVDVDGFFSDNTNNVTLNTPSGFDGPEGAFDALTLTPTVNSMGSVRVINYSSMRHPNATTNKIKRWWNMNIPAISTSTIIFRIRTANDCPGYNQTNLSPYEWNGAAWIKMSTAVPTVTPNGTDSHFSNISFTGVNFLATKGNHIVTLGSSNDGTLPVELSSFTAIVTPQNFVRLDWITQSETGVLGYYIYRNVIENANNAAMVSPLIAATNTSLETAYSFTDQELPGDGIYYYWLQNQDINGMSNMYGPIMATVHADNTDTPDIPLVTSLNKPYPNPFNPTVTISYGLSKAEHVQILIYNNKGQKICTLLDAAKNPGEARLVWNGLSENGTSLSTGIYYVKMTAGNYHSTQKIVLMK